jgi:hypothetical protein
MNAASFVFVHGGCHGAWCWAPVVERLIARGHEATAIDLNRGNPYPSPSFLAKSPQTHVLETFDCRHLNNPLYVPPTGSGVPPCLQQQPWEFNGVTRSYPHLEEAPP